MRQLHQFRDEHGRLPDDFLVVDIPRLGRLAIVFN